MASADVRAVVASKRAALWRVFRSGLNRDGSDQDDEDGGGLLLGDFCSLLRAKGLLPRPVSNDAAAEIFRRAQGATDGNSTDVMVYTEWVEAVAALAGYIYPS